MRSSTKLKPVCLLWFKKQTNSIITTWIDWMTFMNWLQPKFWKVRSKILWRFPEIGGTPKSSMLIGFSLINQSFGVPRFMEPPLQAHRFSMVQLYSPWENESGPGCRSSSVCGARNRRQRTHCTWHGAGLGVMFTNACGFLGTIQWLQCGPPR